MKRFIIFSLSQLLIFLAPFSSAISAEPRVPATMEQQHFSWGQRDGNTAADTSKTGATEWFGNGFIGGLLLGPVGTTIAAVTSHSHPDIPDTYESQLRKHTTPYQDGFAKGYKESVNRKALTNSLIGGAVGTVVLGIVVALAIGASLGSMNMDMGSGSY